MVVVVVTIGVVRVVTVVTGVVTVVTVVLVTLILLTDLAAASERATVVVEVPLVLAVVTTNVPGALDDDTLGVPGSSLTIVGVGGVGLPAAAPCSGVASVVNPADGGIVHWLAAILTVAHAPP
jgi:hypothetical protein